MSASRITQALKTIAYDPQAPRDFKCDGLKFGISKEYELTVANDKESKIEAYRLVYKSYIERGYTSEHVSKMWYSLFDAHPDTITFLVLKNTKAVGTITVVYDSLLGLPCEELYKEELDSLRGRLRFVAEVVSLAIDESERGANEILAKLFNIVIRYAHRKKGATDFLITVNPRHSFFYCRKLKFQKLGEEKAYQKVSGAPAVLLHLDLEEAEEIVKNKDAKEYQKTVYPKFFDFEDESKIFEELRLRCKPLSASDFSYFFKSERKSFLRAAPWQKKYIREFYGFLKPKSIAFLSTFKKFVS